MLTPIVAALAGGSTVDRPPSTPAGTMGRGGLLFALGERDYGRMNSFINQAPPMPCDRRRKRLAPLLAPHLDNPRTAAAALQGCSASSQRRLRSHGSRFQ
jgi:hypothetical protein